MITVLKVIKDYEKQAKNIALLGKGSIAYLFSEFEPSVKTRRFNFRDSYILGVDSSTGGTKVTVSDAAEWIKQGYAVRWTLSNTDLKGELKIFDDLELMYSFYPEIKKREEEIEALRRRNKKTLSRERNSDSINKLVGVHKFKIYGLKG